MEEEEDTSSSDLGSQQVVHYSSFTEIGLANKGKRKRTQVRFDCHSCLSFILTKRYGALSGPTSSSYVGL